MKNRFEDIIPSDKRSIRNIPLSAKQERELSHASMDGIHPKAVRPKTTKKKVVKPIVETVESGGIQESYGEWNESRKKRGWKTWAVLIVFVLIAGYFLSTYFAHADINISLAKHDVVVSGATIPLSKINYSVVSTDISKTVTVGANGTQQVTKKASGVVVIYNAANSSPQILSVNTRLETPDGHIFKIDKQVTVPAVKTVNGKKTPGSVEVNAVADQPGDEYNLGLKDFTLPGFKGTDKYTTFYARSKVALSGGFVGTVPNVSQTDLANTVTSLKKTIANETLTDIVSKTKEASTINDDYVYIPDASIVEYSSPDIKLAKDGKSADVTVTAKATALIVSNSSLAHLLVESDQAPQATPTSSTSGGQFLTGSYSADFSKLTLDLPSELTSKSLVALTNASTTSVSVTASGTAAIVSAVDTKAVAAAVSHLSRTQAVDVVKGIVDFEAIEVAIKPWWVRSLPNASKIKINIEK